MKKTLLSLILSTGFIFSLNSHAAWLKSYSQAISKAKSENKPILADVSGQNWCIWCKRLDQEVFDTSEFKNYARKNLILLLIDVPNPNNLSNEAKDFLNKYPINGYPTVFLLDKNGKILLKTGYQRGGPKNYIKSLKPFIKKEHSTQPAASTKASNTEPEISSNEENTPDKSKEEITEINTIITQYVKSGEDIEDSFIQENIIEEINKKFPIKKEFTPNKINDIEITELAAKLTEKKYPKELIHLRDEYQKQAEKKYYTVKRKDKVEVKFKLGTSVFTADGIFYGYTNSGNGIIVGRNKIAIFDLLPESKCLFSSKLCNEMREDYVKQKISLYLKKKNFFSKQQRDLAKSLLIKQNEDAGYIFYNSRWEHPEQVAKSLLDKKLDSISDLEYSANQEQNNDNSYDESFQNDNNVPQQEIEKVLKNFNPLIFIPIVLLMTLFGICSFICLIVSFVRMFQNGKTAIGIICIILSIFSGIGPIIAFIYCWTKVNEFGISKLMKFWTICFVLNFVLMIVLFWQFFAVISPLFSNYHQF